MANKRAAAGDGAEPEPVKNSGNGGQGNGEGELASGKPKKKRYRSLNRFPLDPVFGAAVKELEACLPCPLRCSRSISRCF